MTKEEYAASLGVEVKRALYAAGDDSFSFYKGEADVAVEYAVNTLYQPDRCHIIQIYAAENYGDSSVTLTVQDANDLIDRLKAVSYWAENSGCQTTQ